MYACSSWTCKEFLSLSCAGLSLRVQQNMWNFEKFLNLNSVHLFISGLECQSYSTICLIVCLFSCLAPWLVFVSCFQAVDSRKYRSTSAWIGLCWHFSEMLNNAIKTLSLTVHVYPAERTHWRVADTCGAVCTCVCVCGLPCVCICPYTICWVYSTWELRT